MIGYNVSPKSACPSPRPIDFSDSLELGRPHHHHHYHHIHEFLLFCLLSSQSSGNQRKMHLIGKIPLAKKGSLAWSLKPGAVGCLLGAPRFSAKFIAFLCPGHLACESETKRGTSPLGCPLQWLQPPARRPIVEAQPEIGGHTHGSQPVLSPCSAHSLSRQPRS